MMEREMEKEAYYYFKEILEKNVSKKDKKEKRDKGIVKHFKQSYIKDYVQTYWPGVQQADYWNYIELDVLKAHEVSKESHRGETSIAKMLDKQNGRTKICQELKAYYGKEITRLLDHLYITCRTELKKFIECDISKEKIEEKDMSEYNKLEEKRVYYRHLIYCLISYEFLIEEFVEKYIVELEDDYDRYCNASIFQRRIQYQPDRGLDYDWWIERTNMYEHITKCEALQQIVLYCEYVNSCYLLYKWDWKRDKHDERKRKKEIYKDEVGEKMLLYGNFYKDEDVVMAKEPKNDRKGIRVRMKELERHLFVGENLGNMKEWIKDYMKYIGKEDIGKTERFELGKIEFKLAKTKHCFQEIKK